MVVVSSAMFKVGELATFIYHDKLRVGEVETVSPTFVRLKLDEKDVDKKDLAKYKSFNYSKIKLV